MLSTISIGFIETSGKYLRSRSPPNVTLVAYILSRCELNSIGSSSADLDSLGCLLSGGSDVTLLVSSGAASGFSTARVTGGCDTFSVPGCSGMTGFMSGGVGVDETGGVSIAGAGGVLGVTIDATGKGGADCVGDGFGVSGGLTG